MKFFIVLSAVAAIALGHPGYHLAGPSGHGYHGPPAPLAHDGRVIDTPEVAHAKAVHFAAHAEAASQAHYAAPYGDYGHGGASYGGAGYEHGAPLAHAYHGPPAPLGHDGRVVDTPEVAHAKAAHLSTLAEAYARAHHSGHGYYGSPAHQW